MICYRVRFADLNRHLFEIECRISDPAQQQQLRLPAWIPGSYLLRDYARHVVSIEAHCDEGRPALSKTDSSTWLVEGARGILVVRMRVYALDLSVRGAYLDGQRAYLNGTCVFLMVGGREQEPVEVTLELPQDPRASAWRVGTSMSRVEVDARGFGRYVARDYDDLIDHPIEISDFAEASFVAADVPHTLIVAGRHDADLDRVVTDLRQLCETQLEFFGAPAPFDHYIFLALAVEKGYGGLEHRASSSLVFDPGDLPRPAEPGVPREYQRFLSLCSHEYFHAWHIKQLKPAAFSPYRLNERNYTRLLWVFEGITSYYQDLMLLRADLIGREAYLDRLAQQLTRVYRTPGRAVQTLADASFDAWDKLYKPEPNSVNATVSYYTKGALVALALDLTVRRATGSSASLDRVLKALWSQYGRLGRGLGEDDFERVAADVSGVPLQPFFDQAIRSTEDPPLAELLASFGIELELTAAAGPQDLGGRAARRQGERPLSLGVTVKDSAAGLELGAVLNGGPAEAAGLIAGDQLVAIGGYRVDAASLPRRLARHEAGEVVPVVFFRRNELMQTELTLADAPLDTCSLLVREDADAEAVALRCAWLGS